MATSREERMQQRMRGAGRHEVADDSFGFILPVAEPSPEPSLPQNRSEPNTSAKRRRLNNEPRSAPRMSSSPSVSTRSSGLSSGQKSVQMDTVRQDVEQRPVFSPPTTKRIAASLSTLNLNLGGTPQGDANDVTPRADVEMVDAPDGLGDLEFLPDPTPQRHIRDSIASSTSKVSDEVMLDLMEEVSESPDAAPGSGRRRRIERPDTVTRSQKLQRLVMEEEENVGSDLATTSSPLERKVRRSTNRSNMSYASRASTAKPPSSPMGTIPESSPAARMSLRSDGTVPPSSARSTRSQHRRSTLSAVAFEGESLSVLPDAVGTPRDTQQLASQTPHKSTQKSPQKSPYKSPHKSPYDLSGSEEEDQQPETGADDLEISHVDAEDEEPNNEDTNIEETELEATVVERTEIEDSNEGVEVQAAEVEGAVNEEADDELAEAVDDHEAANRIGGRRLRVSPRQKKTSVVADSPIVEVEQTGKRKRPRQNIASPAKQAQPKPPRKKRKPSEKKDGESIPITVQRYTKPLRREDADSDEDILNADIPFTDHKSPNVVDVVLQICEESIEKYLNTLHEESSTADQANRKILRTKLRTVEAFQEELRTRLQAQAIALDNLRTLKKRVRATQKEKIQLRNDILRIRAEREQVALKIDTVRMRHEIANKETLHQLGLSSTMDDIELAIENGKVAPEPDAKERKVAELANLDLRISQIADQVSAANDGGGTLRKIREFNMLLERAASALEGR